MIFTPLNSVINKSITFLLGVLFFCVFSIATSEQVQAQNQYNVKGTVKKSRKKTEGAIVTLYKGSQQVSQQTTTSSGRFDVNMDLDAEYTLTITKAGHITKKFYFNFKGIPDDRAKEDFGGQDIEVSIFEMPKDPGVVSQINQILSQPIAKFYYDDKIKEVDFDKAYSQSMQDALAKLNQVEQEAIKKAEEEAKNKSAAESAAASKYEAAIIKGDAAFAKKDYTNARAAYTDALSIKPGEAYPKNKIVEIEKLIADAAKNAALEADYKAAIAKADAAFTAKNYDAAKISYTDALKLKPAEAYPKGKLDEITKLLADAAKNAELENKYKSAIQKGDAALSAKTYESAKAAYAEASGLKPAEKYPKDKIAEIDKILADILAKEKADKELDDKYKAAIANADKSFASKLYTFAKPGYEEALKLKPNEAYPKTKIAEIDKILADLAAKEGAEKAQKEKYDAAIAKGDKALAGKDYAGAKSAYNEALSVKSTEQYPKDKIAEIDKALADAAAKDAAEKDRLAKEKALNDKYNAAIAKGDAALAKKDYATAKAGYTEATGLKSAEQYPKDKLAEVEKALEDAAKGAEADAKYKAAIAKADAAAKAKNFEAAKAGYNEALAIKGSEQYPKDKIAEIDAFLAKDAASKEQNEKYNLAIAKGNKTFDAKQYEEAKAAYNEALGYKPAEAYPKAQLAAIDKAIADAAAKDAADKARLAKEKELAEKYAAAIAKADAALGTKDYSAAKTAYTEALTYKATEKYPKDKIAEIDAILAKEMGAKALEEKYKAAIAKGDAAITAKTYAAAKAAFNEAIGYKPSEQYPKDKLAEVEKALADEAAEKDRLAKEKELETKYKAAVAKGDAALKAKTYAAAKTAYNEALTLKSTEQYPKDKIAEIDALIAKEMGAKELDDKYKAALAKGDAAFKTKAYEDAKAGYNEAIGFKPAEAYPKSQLAAIDKAIADAAAKDAADQARLAKEKELAEKYAAAIAKGDAALGAKDYEAAKTGYNEALALKATEKYPKDKITEINAILAKEMGAKELEKKYADAISKGDAGLSAKEYAVAKTQYTAALALKPSEQYPKDKLAEVEKALAEIAAANKGKELEAKYTAAIAKGDAAFTAKTYAAAKTAYNEALTYKPSEQYPKDKVAEIETLLAGDAAEKARLAKEKELQAKYNAAIAKGDAALKAKTYAAAKTAYNEALAVKPGEQYPTDKLSEIDSLMDAAASEKDRQAVEAKYKSAIAKGDAALKAKTYAAAKTAYNEALAVKPGEQYPTDKLSEIDALMDAAASEKDRQAIDAKYKSAIAKGDAALKAKTYEAAKTAYNDALGIKSAEQYPKDKLAEIEKILAELANKDAAGKQLNEKYLAAVAKGDAALASKDYDGAKAAYNEALGLKSAEKYPKDKIASIDAMLAKEAGAKELEEKYKAAVTKGDADFTAKDYAAAKTAYSEASTLKPSEQYPKDQLVKVNAALGDIAKTQAVQAKYDAAVVKADGILAKKDYNNAILAYKEAQAIKPNEPYPGNKISEINSIVDGLAKAKAKDAEYQEIIAKGDKLFELKDYKSAKNKYLDASLVKPTEKYPKDRVAEIDVLLKKKNTTTTTTTTANNDQFKSELAKKYPEGITEESARENNAKVTRRIVVKGSEGHLYLKKETSFGPIYYFKDNVPITETEYLRDTEVQSQ